MSDENLSCPCCGSKNFEKHDVLWKLLIDEWRLAPYEANYIDRQQGLVCVNCGVNLRSMVLAKAFMKAMNFQGLFKEFVETSSTKQLKILEINQAGPLTHWLNPLPHRQLVEYPAVDMMALPYDPSTFDIVIHSDTLEHIEHPVRALSECQRVLKRGGFCLFTVPMVVDRLTASRKGLPPSYHGQAKDLSSDYLVFTEYGCDAWRQVILAGFNECRIVSIEFPSAQALVGVN